MVNFLSNLDRLLFLAINGWNHPIFDTFFYFVSETTSWIPLYLLLLYFFQRRYGWRGFGFGLLFIVLLISLADSGSVHLFKNVFERLRPCHQPDLEGMVHLVRGHCGGKYGFISSHAANTMAIALFFGLALRKTWIWIALFTYAFLTGYSRIYLGVHYPFDVLGGFMYGGIAGAWVYLLFHWLIRKIPFIKPPLSFESNSST